MLTTIGVGLAVAFNPLTSYFTSTKKPPVKEIVKSTQHRPGDHHSLRPFGRYGIVGLGAGCDRDQLYLLAC